MLELLAPAGSPEAVIAAVQNGAHAVYFGYGAHNARRNAKNLSPEEAAAAVSYCHTRGVKVYLTLNTLVTDRELPAAAALGAQACDMGVDAVLVQDLGLARALRLTAPDLPLHASTQMTVHSLDGVRFCAALGLKRVVLSRELSHDAIAHITAHSPIEIEVFVHGALCMCYSGQCLMSAAIGGRSGNRGLCAQPCRLKYGWQDRASEHLLSLKDLSLANHLQALRRLGVACVKIEGRMKRPEYVGVVTRVYSDLIREGRAPTEAELIALESAFSRDGFTDGYFTGQTGGHMFGVRPEGTRDPEAFFAKVRKDYQENLPIVPVKLYALIRGGEAVQVAAQDAQGRIATVSGETPEPARTHALTRETAQAQLAKTGGTPYVCQSVQALVEPDLSVPLSALNALRRRALADLTALRTALPARQTLPFHPGARYENRTDPPIIGISLTRANQFSPALMGGQATRLDLPAAEIAAHPAVVEQAMAQGMTVAAVLPRVAWDRELPELRKQLVAAKALGVTDALVGTYGLIDPAREMGFTLRGDFSLWVYNTQTLKELRRLGFVSATVSPELRLAQIRDLSKGLDCELLVYGNLPLMLTEHCLIKLRGGGCTCQGDHGLTDRTGARFPVLPAPGCRSEILNAQPLYLADKYADWCGIGVHTARLHFTTEDAAQCARITQRYRNQGDWAPPKFTRGLYYREVE